MVNFASEQEMFDMMQDKLGAADPGLGVTMADIIRGVIPFVVLIAIGLGLFVAFPDLILWLPGMMVK
ncbi:MAG: hypothetical protein ACE5KP_05920 [Dehalococcoidales bacterium]